MATLATLWVAAPGSAQQLPPNSAQGMKWRLIGPFRGGRVLAVAGVAGDPTTYYFGGVAGGVWKSTNGGVTWVPLWDKEAVSSIGAIAVAPSDSNIVYAGSGEACIRGNISFGDGVYKSLDAGKTWTNVGLKDTQHIARVLIDPRDSNRVYVAALGHAYGSNAERGVFRTLDGGKSWEKVLYQDEKTGAIDLVFDPGNAHTLYAAMYQVYRTPWSLVSGGPGSGIYKSGDGGSTWKRLEGHGLPEGIMGRIGLAVGADPSRVYALIEAEKGGLYRSEDAGQRWTLVNGDHRFRQRAWYFTHIFADPNSTDTVYILNTGLFRSTDGGKSFELLPAPHGDHHGLWIDPRNPRRLINGNDGGVTISVDGGKSWTQQDNQPTAQFYHVAADNRFDYYLYGAQQDNTTVAIASRTSHGSIRRTDWYEVGGGESGYIVPDPRDPFIVYAGDNYGRITRYDKRTEQEQEITVWPVNPSGYGAGALKYRFQWTAPILISPHDPNTLYIGGQQLFRTVNGGMSWTALSPDLTRNDKSKQEASGGPITKDNTSVEYYDVIFTVAESTLLRGLLWVGTDDGWVQISRDGGASWANVTPKGLPEWSLVSLIEASPHDAGTAYAAVDCHKLDDLRPYIFKTTDYGQTWKNIAAGLPDTAYVHAVREDPARKGLLYAGTETGVFVSLDDGGHWQPLQLNLPIAPIHDLMVKDDDLVAATHGRSFWILDDLSVVRQFAASSDTGEVRVFPPRTAWRFRTGDEVPEFLLRWYGKNAPGGAVINYFLKTAPKDEIRMEILDDHGGVVRRLSSKPEAAAEASEQHEWPEQVNATSLLPVEAGINRFTWNLRYDGPTSVPGAFFDGGLSPKGPLAAPGAYRVRLIVAGRSYEVPLELKADPRVKSSAEDLQKELRLLLQIREAISQAHRTVNQIRELRGQLQALRKRLEGHGQAKPIASAAEQIDEKITAVEGDLIQNKIEATEDSLNYPPRLNNLLSSLANVVEDADAAPAEQCFAAFRELSGRLATQLAAWRKIVHEDIAALNDQMRKANIPAVAVSAGAGANP